MLLYPNADVAVGPVLCLVPMFGVILFLIVVGLETAVLKLMGWGSTGRSLRDSFLMNLVSTIIGAILFIFLAGLDSIYLPLLIAFILSVLIEGLILLPLNQTEDKRQGWIISLVANIVSYALIFILALVTGA